MDTLECHLNHDEDDDHPLESHVMDVVQVGRHQISQLYAMVQLFVHYLET